MNGRAQNGHGLSIKALDFIGHTLRGFEHGVKVVLLHKLGSAEDEHVLVDLSSAKFGSQAGSPLLRFVEGSNEVALRIVPSSPS